MAHQAIEKYAEVPPVTRSTAGGVHEELRHLDPIHRFVARLAARNFQLTSESTLSEGTSFLFMPYHSLTYDDRR